MVLIIPITPPDEGLIYTSSNIKLKIGNVVVGNGTMYICQNSLSWQPDDRPEGIAICWKQISVHGISTEPTKCIYFMLDHRVTWRGVYEGANRRAVVANGNGAAGAGHDGVAVGVPMDGVNNGHDAVDVDEGNETDEDDSEPDEEQMTECWFLPEDVNSVDTMFQAMTECQALHPDSADSSLSDESDFMDDDGGDVDAGLGPNGPGAADGNNGDGADADAAQGGMRNLNLDDDRFADADE